jgi:putative nucleotidyltransferase with HDIG domain
MIKKVSTDELKLGMYIYDLNCAWMKHPFLRKSFMLRKEADLRTILDSPSREVYIDTLKGLDAAASLEEGAPEAPAAGEREVAPEIPPPAVPARSSFLEELAIASRIKQEAHKAMRSIMADVRIGRQIQVEQLNPVVSQITDSILRNPGTLVSLCRIREADAVTFQHSVSVSAMLVMFCHHLGMDREILHEAGMAGMLHDIGKMQVPDHILNKPGRLTGSEFEIMKGHVQLGTETLRQTPGISDIVLQVAGEHHEQFKGSGYPSRRKGDEISWLGRMASIVDVYDALTSKRAYHEGIEPASALHQLYGCSPGLFDEELVQHFIRAIGIYPTGSLVLLASNRLGAVIEQNEGSPLRPKVRIVYDLALDRKVAPLDVDLSLPAHAADGILGHEDPRSWNFGLDFTQNLDYEP